MANKKNLVHRVKITDNFFLDEFLFTLTENTIIMPVKYVENIVYLCEAFMQPLRNQFGPIRITSGYRTQELNEEVGGAANSAHLTGEAADFYALGPYTPQEVYDWAEKNLNFDYISLYSRSGHIHVTKRNKKRMVR